MEPFIRKTQLVDLLNLLGDFPSLFDKAFIFRLRSLDFNRFHFAWFGLICVSFGNFGVHELNVSLPDLSEGGVIEKDFLEILSDTIEWGDSLENVGEFFEVSLLFHRFLFFFFGFSLFLWFVIYLSRFIYLRWRNNLRGGLIALFFIVWETTFLLEFDEKVSIENYLLISA